MTDKLIERIKADREAGTRGPWEVTYERGCTHLMMRDHPDMESQMCDNTYYPWVPENDSDWHRIARVPDMEARILADAKIIKAAEELLQVMDMPNQSCGDTSTYHYKWEKVDSAIEAYRAAVSERDT